MQLYQQLESNNCNHLMYSLKQISIILIMPDMIYKDIAIYENIRIDNIGLGYGPFVLDIYPLSR